MQLLPKIRVAHCKFSVCEIYVATLIVVFCQSSVVILSSLHLIIQQIHIRGSSNPCTLTMKRFTFQHHGNIWKNFGNIKEPEQREWSNNGKHMYLFTMNMVMEYSTPGEEGLQP